MKNKNHFDTIDLLFLLIAPRHIILFFLCVLQYFIRHHMKESYFDFIMPNKKQIIQKQQNKIVIKQQTTNEIIEPKTFDDLLTTLLNSVHLFIIGYTGGGKTTLLYELANRWNLHDNVEIIVFDVDYLKGTWANCRVFGAGDDFAGIDNAIEVLNKFINYRRHLRNQGITQFKHLFIIIDEAQIVLNNSQLARPFIEDILRRGRKLNVHLVIGVQDTQVKTLKLEGASQLLINAKICLVKLINGHRTAIINKVQYPISDIEYIKPSAMQLEGIDLQLPEPAKSLSQPIVQPSNDAVDRFIDDCVVVAIDNELSATELYNTYVQWCLINDIQQQTITKFGTDMSKKNYKKIKNKKGKIVYLNINTK